MAVDSTSSTSSVNMSSLYGVKNNGIGGLASGLDTDSIVQALTAGTRSKIATQQQQKTLLQWQQTAYRGVGTTLRAFQNQWLGTSKTSIGMNSFFYNFKGTSSSDKVTFLDSATTGAGTVKIDEIRQLATSETITIDKQFSQNTITSQVAEFANGSTKYFEGQVLELKLEDGSTKKIDLKSLDAIIAAHTVNGEVSASSALQDDLNAKLKELTDAAFGTRSTTSGGDTNDIVRITVNVTDIKDDTSTKTGAGFEFNIQAENNKVTVMADNSALALKAGQTNFFNRSQSIKDAFGLEDGLEEYSIKINGAEIKVKATESVSTLMSRINTSKAGVKVTFDDLEGQFTFTSEVSGAGENIVFEAGAGELLDKFVGTYTREAGQNAEIVVGGRVIVSNTNRFTINNVAFEVNAETTAEEIAAGGITITSKSDPDTMVEKITKFVDDYNALVTSLTAILNEKKNSDYTPLSEEQKSQMTADQIKTWEEEAKKGLLRNDNTLRSILNDLRGTVTKKVEAAGLSLYDIGISTASYYNSSGTYDQTKAGTLVINEERLRNAIELNPDGVRILFTNVDENDQGIAQAVNSAIDRAASESSDPKKRGSLVRLAGTETLTSDNTSQIGNKIDTIDKYIETLKTRLTTQYNRYWSQFTALETAIAKMNSQASMFMDYGS